MQLVGIIEKCNQTYGISIPDLPGCVSAGNSEQEAIANGLKAIAFHLEGMLEDGAMIPVPRTLESLRADPEFRVDFEGHPTIVQLPFSPKAVEDPGVKAAE